MPIEKSEEKSDEKPIVLTNKFGLPPVVYIPIMYASILLLLIAGGISYSLIKNHGQTIKINTTPPHAAIFIDDAYIGSSPIKTFLPKGVHSINVSLPFYTTQETSIKTKNPIIKFLSPVKKHYILIPERLPISEVAPYSSPENISENTTGNISEIFTQKEANNLIAYTIQNLASWNISNTQDARHHIPPILKDTFSQLEHIQTYLLQTDPPQNAELENITHIIFSLLYESMPYLANPARAGKKANINTQEHTWTQQYELFSQSALFEAYDKKWASEQDSKRASEQDSKLGFVYKKALLEKFYQSLTKAKETVTDTFPQYTRASSTAPSAPTIRIDDLSFTYIAPQTIHYDYKKLREVGIQDPIQTYMEVIIQAKDKKNDTSSYTTLLTPAFYIMNNEITQADFQSFLTSTAMSIQTWKTLSEKKVSSDYKDYHFFDYNPAHYPHRPLRYITWYDAYAFVVWFNRTHPIEGYRAKLPNEFEWNAAITAYPNRPILEQAFDYIPTTRPSQIPQLLGNLWEWGDSWYSPAPHYAGYDGPSYGSEKHIFGGSYITKKSQMIGRTPLYLSRNTAAPPTWANEFIGFRLVLVATSSE